LAKRWVNSSRRNLLRRGQQEGSRRLSEISLMHSERMPLKSSVKEPISEGQAEDFEGKTTTEEYTKEGIVAALKGIVLGKVVSVLLLLIPLAFLSHYQQWSATWIFWLNFCVMIPLAAILGDFTEEAALHTNDTIGGLLNATFGNAVEVVVAIQALLANEIRVVQASLIGSIFSNLLLVLGCCFFFGGLKHKEQTFNATAATANMGLLALSSIALVLPTPFAEYYQVQDEHVLIISRVAAVFLLFMYIQLLVFQLYTHAYIFEKPASEEDDEEDDEDGEAEEEEKASIPMSVALLGLALTTLSVTVFSNFLVSSIDEYCEISGVSRTFVGLIILPIVGNAVEHITAVTVAMKNKMDLAMGGKASTRNV
jgi:Ca2+:H+ antiporter